MKVLICRGNFETPKSYPHWEELLKLINDHVFEVKELKGIVPEATIIDMVNWCDVWITVDSFLPHLCAFKKLKPGIVLWGKSDPNIFGYSHNVNLLKNRDNLRPGKEQFMWWKDVPYDKDIFVSPQEVVDRIIVR
jgi:hypothetical protein